MANGLRDILFGMVLTGEGQFPQTVSDLDAVNDLFQIVLSMSPREMPWLAVSGDMSPILFEQMNKQEMVSTIEQRLAATCVKFLPFVDIVSVTLIESFEKSELAVEVLYLYRGQDGAAQVKL